MYKTCRWVLPFLMMSATAQAENEPMLNGLSQNAVQTAFQLLRRDYIRRDDLTFEELNRAALQGLLERLDLGAELVPVTKEPVVKKPYVLQEFLSPGIAYLRPESFSEGEGALFESALQEVVSKGATNVILDLRSAGAGEFEEAAKVLQCFIGNGEVMFKMKQIGQEEAELYVSKRDPIWKDRVIVLIDQETGSAAEAVAWTLYTRQRALMIGEKTRGATVRFTELGLDDQTRLRYASAEMLLPDGASLFKHGLTPPFLVDMSMDDKHKIQAASHEKGMKSFVNDRVRPRYNEAALVAGTNPELDDYVRKSKGQALPGDEGQLRDSVVQRALDMLRAEQFTAEAKIKWDAPLPPPEPGPVIPKALPSNP